MIETVLDARKDARLTETRPHFPNSLVRGGRLIKTKRGIISFAALGALMLSFYAVDTTFAQTGDLSWNSGSGVWDLTTPAWDSGGGNFVPWNNGELSSDGTQMLYDSASFKGSGGVITIGNGEVINAYELRFSSGPYDIEGGTIAAHNVTERVNGNDSTRLTIVNNASGAVTIGSVISDPRPGIKGALNIDGDQRVILTGENTYSEMTLVNGILQIGDGGTRGSVVTTSQPGGHIEVSKAGTLYLDHSNNIALNSTRSYGVIHQIGSGQVEFKQGNPGGVIYIDNGAVQLDQNASQSPGSVHISGGKLQLSAIALNADVFTDSSLSEVETLGSSQILGSLSGNGTLLKTGVGDLTLKKPVSTNGIVIRDGSITITGSASNGRSNTWVTDDARLNFVSNAPAPTDATANGVISGTGQVDVGGQGVTIFSADNSYAGGTTIATGSTLQLGLGGTTGSIEGAVSNYGSLTFNHSGEFTFTNQVGGRGKLVISGQKKVTLTGQNTYTGGTFVTNSVVSAANDAAFGSDTGGLNLADSSLLLTGDVSSARDLVLRGSVDTLASDFDTALSGELTGEGALVKTGVGTLTLSGRSDSYAEPITVAGGGLVADGSIAASVVADRGTFVSGSGSVGDLTIADGASLRGTQGQILTAKSVSLGDQSSTDVTLGTPESAGLFDVSGDLHLGGTLNVTDGGGFSAGVYRIFNYGGTLSGSMAIGGLPSNADINRVTLQTNQPHQVNLINASGVTLSFWDGANPANLDNNRVDGGDGTWDAQQQFWTDANGSQNGNWAAGSFAIFSGEKGTVTVDNNKGAVSAAGMQFMTDGYVLAGAALALDNDNTTPIITVGDHSDNSASISATIEAELTGSHGMDKTDAGRLILTADNSYTGTTTVSGGVLQLGNDSTAGSVKDDILIAKGAELEIRHSNDLRLDHAISGAGQVLQNGDGTTTLAADNSFSGGLTVQKGTAKAGFDAHSFGSGLLTVEQAGTVALDGYNTTVGGLAGSGAVHLDGATLTLNQDINTKFGGSIDGKGSFTKDGTGVIELSGENSYEGQSLIENGSVLQTGQSAISANSVYSVSNPARVDLGGFSSTMAGLTNAGTVRFGDMKSGTVLDVIGDYHGQGGTLVMNTVLGDDHSATDQLVIGGSTDGDTKLQIVNRGGLGAQTVDGIKVVDVSGKSDGTFELAKGDFVTKDGEQAVIGGAYAYTLHKNGKTTPDDGNWYLRSELKDPQVNPGNPDPAGPLYSPTAPVYEGLINNMQSLNRLSSLRERVGDHTYGDDPQAFYDFSQYDAGENSNRDNSGHAIWARVEGAHDNLRPNATTDAFRQQINQLSYRIDTDGQLYDGDKGVIYFGLSGRYGTAESHIASEFGHGSIDTTAWSLQGTITWYGNDGYYIDAQAQASLYRNDLFSKTTNNGFASGVHGTGYAMSLEGGKQFDLNETWSLTPQAQLAWSSVGLNDFTDIYQSRVSAKDDQSLQLRMGVAADYRNAWTTVSGMPIKADLYGIANLYQDFAGDSTLAISDVTLKTRNDRTWGGIGFGGSFAWDNQYALYGQGSVNSSLNHFGASTAIAGTIGFRKWW